MQKGLQTRLIIHEILYLIKFKNKNLDNLLIKKFDENNFMTNDKKLIHNVILTSMRLQYNINIIIRLYAKKKLGNHQYIILLSAITQLIFLDFKEYAVINCSVELAKNKKINAVPNFINAILRKILKNKIQLIKTSPSINDLPHWLSKELNFLSKKNKTKFIETIIKKPNLHCVFKKEINKNCYNLNTKKTSIKSLCFSEYDNINLLPGYKEGDWWVQDYSAMLPMHLANNLKDKNVLDMCAAPGGKTFQLISMGAKLDIIEKNILRAKVLKENLKRLKYTNNNIKIIDALNLNENIKYDYILIDAPCSSLGTIRRNPEILFRNGKINKDKYLNIQKNLLEKASKLLKKNGIIIYMVCSFLKVETVLQVKNFLNKHTKFSIQKFKVNQDSKELIDENGLLNILPREYKNILIDGFFAAKFIKND